MEGSASGCAAPAAPASGQSKSMADGIGAVADTMKKATAPSGPCRKRRRMKPSAASTINSSIRVSPFWSRCSKPSRHRDRRLLWSEDIVSINKKISELSSQNQTLAFLKQNGLVDPDIFISKSNELTRQLRQAKLDKEELMAAEGDATAQRTRELIALLEDGPDFLDRPDAELMGELVEKIIIESNDTLRFRLHNGLELRESIERTVR